MLDIMKEETLQKVLNKMQMQNAYLAAIAGAEPGTVRIGSLKDIAEIVKAGLAKKIFAVGDQIICPWTDIVSGKTYDFVWDIVHMGDVELESGKTVPGMYLQSHYATLSSIQFDHPENEPATEETAQEGLYYYGYDGSTYTYLSTLTTGDIIPYSDYTAIYHSEIKDTSANICRYGYNRWSHSAYRQYLNSTAGVNEWWSPQHAGDVAPDQLKTVPGFLSGFDKEFLSVINPIKVTTALNTVTDSGLGQAEDTYDLMFLPGLEQLYIKPQLSGEGEYWDYWKMATGASEPQAAGGTYAERITYAIENKTSPQNVCLRSAYRGTAYHAWSVNSSGSVYNHYAYNAYRCAPACVICQSE